MPQKETLLVINHISKAFGAVQALKSVSFELYRGEIVALVGDNGAGKSTLVKIISGLYPATSGELIFKGAPVAFRNPADALAMGIETVYQHLALIEQLDVADNVYLGRETTRWGAIGRWLRAQQQMTMLIISHNMQDVYRSADRVVVMRQGKHVATLNKGETTTQEIVAYMTGAKEPHIAAE